MASSAAAGVVTRELRAGGRPANAGGDAPPAEPSSQPDGEAGADGSGATEARDGAREGARDGTRDGARDAGSVLRCRFGFGGASTTALSATCMVRRWELSALWRHQGEAPGQHCGVTRPWSSAAQRATVRVRAGAPQARRCLALPLPGRRLRPHCATTLSASTLDATSCSHAASTWRGEGAGLAMGSGSGASPCRAPALELGIELGLGLGLRLGLDLGLGLKLGFGLGFRPGRRIGRRIGLRLGLRIRLVAHGGRSPPLRLPEPRTIPKCYPRRASPSI